MKRAYAAAAGLSGLVLAGVVGANRPDPAQPCVDIRGTPGQLTITLKVGGKSQQVVIEPMADGRFRLADSPVEVETDHVVLRLNPVSMAAEGGTVPNEPQLTPIEPSKPGDADRPPITVPPPAAQVPDLSPADDPPPTSNSVP